MKTRIISIAVLAISFFSAYSQDLDEIVTEVSTAISLDETQTKALETQFVAYAASLQVIFDKYEEAEPDPQAMLTEIKGARNAYHKALKDDIGKEKFTEYEAFVEKVQLEILGEAAYLRLLDLQAPLTMTDEQVQKMKPVMAKAMHTIMSTLMKYVDKTMGPRNKLGAAGALKGAKKTMEAEAAEILSPEQMAKWQEIQEAAKNSGK